MITDSYFRLEVSPVYTNKYYIAFNPKNLPFKSGMTGSFGVFIARLMNLSYTDWLRYCRDRLGAELVGKKSMYVVPYFDRTDATRQLILLLNKRLRYVLNLYNNPYDYVEQEDGTILKVPRGENETNA